MVELTEEKIRINVDEEMSAENLRRIKNLIDSKIFDFERGKSYCSCCGSIFDSMDKNSQHTEDGRLCAECHKTYTIKYDPNEWGAVGIAYTETGEWVNPCPRWL